jgi:hypothetical protein
VCGWGKVIRAHGVRRRMGFVCEVVRFVLCVEFMHALFVRSRRLWDGSELALCTRILGGCPQYPEMHYRLALTFIVGSIARHYEGRF